MTEILKELICAVGIAYLGIHIGLVGRSVYRNMVYRRARSES